MNNALQILVIDDDEVSREVLRLLLESEGHRVDTADSGDAALTHLNEGAGTMPTVILVDMQMPGIRGDELARRLRSTCGAQTLLLAMSGSRPESDLADAFDAFLLKPFSMEQFAALVDTSQPAIEGNEVSGALNESIYQKLANSMSASQLEKLYSMCLSDAENRIDAMQKAAAGQDDAAYRREAHAIKGGCGMVGAVELQSIANIMETKGIEANHVATLHEFLLASKRLQRILIARMYRQSNS